MTDDDECLAGTGEDRALAVLVITDEHRDRAQIVASVRVTIEATGEDDHDALHAIMLVSDGLASGEIAFDDEPGKPNVHAHRFGAIPHHHDDRGNVVPEDADARPDDAAGRADHHGQSVPRSDDRES
jgi:hypothetical protein